MTSVSKPIVAYESDKGPAIFTGYSPAGAPTRDDMRIGAFDPCARANYGWASAASRPNEAAQPEGT